MSLFQRPTATLTPEQKVAVQIDAQLRQAAVSMKTAYSAIRQLVYNNPAFKDEYGVCDSDAIYGAFAQYTTTGLDPVELGKAARLIKAAINSFAPGTIVDSVPSATITY